MIREIFKSTHRPGELSALFQLILQKRKVSQNHVQAKRTDGFEEVNYCFQVLDRVSRSFSAVIRQLPEELRTPVCAFYLVLRGLDSVEDDMGLPIDKKLTILKNFYRHTQDPGFYIEGIGDNADYRELLANYYKVTKVLLSLDPKYQSIIVGICREMGDGMAQFAQKKIETKEDYDQYCYYVAGLVGLGLSQLFSASGIESDELKDQEDLAISMGLFLQKTNIIRDYYEDLLSSRTFWPEGIWKGYANHLEDFACEPKSLNSLSCLNHMVTDALGHASDCISYLKLVKDPLVFRFCAIPQVMAIATLAEVYNNSKTLTSTVKIRKGLAAKMIVETTDIDEVKKTFSETAIRIFNKIDLRDPNCSLIVERLHQIRTGSLLPLATTQFNQDNERAESKQPTMV